MDRSNSPATEKKGPPRNRLGCAGRVAPRYVVQEPKKGQVNLGRYTMDGQDSDRAVRARANELYWSSELSVNQIADELDVSKGTLYDLIRPRPAARGCPECGEELAFANRTARDRGLVACSSCGWEGSEEEAEPYGADTGVELSDDDAVAVAAESSVRTRTLVGGALLGAAAGLALVFWSRRR